MMPLNVAMIATGGIADKQLAPALAEAPNAQLWSVLSRDRERAEAAREGECGGQKRRLETGHGNHLHTFHEVLRRVARDVRYVICQRKRMRDAARLRLEPQACQVA